MSVCQTLTGSGGWPTTIFMTPEQKPFFAGTYFPKNSQWGSIGFQNLLETIADKWQHERTALLASANQILGILKKEAMDMVDKTLLQMYRGGIFDHIGGGFSRYSTDNYFLAPNGGFFSVQDADSEGVEGKYYLFEPDEINNVLGKEEAQAICMRQKKHKLLLKNI